MKKLLILSTIVLVLMFAACNLTETEKSTNETMTEMRPEPGLTRFEAKELEFLSERTTLDIVEQTNDYLIVNWTEKNSIDLFGNESRGPIRCPYPQKLVRTGCQTKYQCKWYQMPGSQSPSWHCYTWTYCSGGYCR